MVLKIDAGSSSVGSKVPNRRAMIALLRASGTIVNTCFAESMAGIVMVMPLSGIRESSRKFGSVASCFLDWSAMSITLTHVVS